MVTPSEHSPRHGWMNGTVTNNAQPVHTCSPGTLSSRDALNMRQPGGDVHTFPPRPAHACTWVWEVLASMGVGDTCMGRCGRHVPA
eukprot:364793-Chlamydomonas_euryale.AAC.7